MVISDDKTRVIEKIYDSLIDGDGNLVRSIVTLDDVRMQIASCRTDTNFNLLGNNTANFFKDIIRGRNASSRWPEKLKNLKITAKQLTGDGNCFQFVPYEEDQTEPFPNKYGYYEGMTSHKIQSFTIPDVVKDFGRNDESFIIQVATSLRIIETHFALFSKLPVHDIQHLQNNVKMRFCEIDGIFVGTVDGEGYGSVVFTVEVKTGDQRVIEEQIINQVNTTFLSMKTDIVVPISISSVNSGPDSGGIYLAEFVPIRRNSNIDSIKLSSEVYYDIVPSIRALRHKSPLTIRCVKNQKTGGILDLFN